KREPKIKKSELEKRARNIALAAIKFYLLKIDPNKNLLFDPEKAISFEGETGPYIQYAYARASSILRKAGKKVSFNKGVLRLKEKEEYLLLRELARFPEVVEISSEQLKPDIVANYAYKLAQTFTNFYSNLQVLTEEKEERKERLQLTEATRQVLENSLKLLNITPLERM
ncbi:MAG: DALR anticodon-binding domain-containing protein, partial [Nanoarchaeota archaeon]